MDRTVSRILVGCLLVLTLAAVAAPVEAQLPASPRRFVNFLDTRCYAIANQPPLNFTLNLTHLNPVLSGLPVETVVLGPLQQLCVPVQKNNQAIPADTLPFIRFVDWKCYGITGPSVDKALTLTQLNPEISGLFGTTVNVTMREPQQLCVPAVKNNSVPPANVLDLVKYLDVKCYRVDSAQTTLGTLTLRHLNPLLAGLPAEVSTIGVPQQLCVPVQKNTQAIPSTILPYIQFADVLCYRASGTSLGQNLTLRHINPLMTTLPAETVLVSNSLKLCVPVAKNGVFPPGAP